MIENTYAVFSDVRGNLEALEAVIEDIKKQNIRKKFFLGDAIGFGANPIECIDLIDSECDIYIRGRIESLVLDGAYKSFGDTVKTTYSWNHKLLSKHNKIEYLKRKNWKHSIKESTFVHANPINEEGCIVFENIELDQSHKSIFSSFSKILFIGGNFVPWYFRNSRVGSKIEESNTHYTFNTNEQVIISVGSVGQPGNRNNKASYVIFSGEKVIWRFIDYDVYKAANKIISCPYIKDVYAERLIKGV